MTRKAVFFAVFIEDGQRRIVSLILWLLGVNLGFFLDYSGRCDAHMCLPVFEVCGQADENVQLLQLKRITARPLASGTPTLRIRLWPRFTSQTRHQSSS